MALKIKLKLDKGRPEGQRYDRFYAKEGDWAFEVFVPHGDDPTTVDVHFEFEDEGDQVTQ